MEGTLKPRKNLRLSGFDYRGSGHTYFVTICSANRQPYFLDGKMAKIIENEIEFRRAKKIKIFCYCIMPDHLHLLISLTEGFQRRLQDWVSVFKRHTAKLADELLNIKPVWQKNFYDHIVRQEESLLEIASLSKKPVF